MTVLLVWIAAVLVGYGEHPPIDQDFVPNI